MPDYILGNNPPILNVDAGSGGWCADPIPSPEALALKLALENLLPSEGLSVFPSVRFITRSTTAVNHLNHYIGNTGKPITVDMNDLTEKSDQLYTEYREELKKAKSFAESLPPGSFSITSSKPDFGAFPKPNSLLSSTYGTGDLYFAIGGYKFWGQADLSITKINDKKYKCAMIFWFHFYDRYNWDWDPKDRTKQKHVDIAGIRIEDRHLQQLHHHCLAREFDIKGLIESKVSWEYSPSPYMQNEAPNRTGELRSAYGQEKYEHNPERQ